MGRAPSTERKRLRAVDLAVWAPFLIASFGPLLFLLLDSLRSEQGFGLMAYRAVWGRASQYRLLLHSVEVGLGVAAVTTLVGGLYGFLVQRTTLRGRRLYEAAALVPLLIPPYVAGIAWTQVFSFGGYWAIVWLLSAGLLPVTVFLSGRAFRAVARDVEDSARLHRGGPRAFLGVTLPLATGALVTAALLVFVLAVTDFVVPDFFSFAGIQDRAFQVAAQDVFARWTMLRERHEAIAAAVPLGLVAALGTALIAFREGRSDRRSFEGSGRAPRPFALGRFALPAHGFLVAVLVLSAGVPLGILGQWVTKGYQGTRASVKAPPPAAANDPASTAASGTSPVVDPTASSQDSASPAAGTQASGTTATGTLPLRPKVTFASVLTGPSAGDLLRSIAYSIGAVVLLLSIAWAPAARLARGGAGRPLALFLVLAPLACPGLLLGMAQVVLFNRSSAWLDAFYEGGGLVVWTLAVRFLPIGVLGLRAVRERLDRSLEESARMHVASPLRRVLRLLGPWMFPGVVGVALLCYALCLRDLETIHLLHGAQKTLSLSLYNKVHYARDAEIGILCVLQLLVVFLPWALVRLLVPAPRSS